MLDLIVITGASKGIGASIANKCSNICRNMIVVASSNKINSLVVENNNCNLIPLQLDLQNYNNIYRQITIAISNLKDINSVGVVLSGAQIGEYGGLLNTQLDDWNKLYQCNVLGNLAVIKAIGASVTKLRIVCLAGGGAAFGYPEFSGYSLSKVATVRAVENLSLEYSKLNIDSSVIALAPGAVATEILDKVIANGGSIRTRTDISEPTNFVYNFLTDVLPSKELNGKFLHVRDDIESIDFHNKDLFTLRRIQ